MRTDENTRRSRGYKSGFQRTKGKTQNAETYSRVPRFAPKVRQAGCPRLFMRQNRPPRGDLFHGKYSLGEFGAPRSDARRRGGVFFKAVPYDMCSTWAPTLKAVSPTTFPARPPGFSSERAAPLSLLFFIPPLPAPRPRSHRHDTHRPSFFRVSPRFKTYPCCTHSGR